MVRRAILQINKKLFSFILDAEAGDPVKMEDLTPPSPHHVSKIKFKIYLQRLATNILLYII